jgi:dipeptidyl aminopeptidase/acylaminoacyl peptidase
MAAAQTAQLTEQLGRTVLYQDIAIAPDGSHAAWTQAVAAKIPAATLHISSTEPGKRPVAVAIPEAATRTDADPAWAPDSKELAFLSTAGEKDQRQLWTVHSDGSGPRKRTRLKGYAARPRWSHDGKSIAFLYIEGAGGGGPLFAAPPATGLIDTEIHNQRLAVLDLASGQLKQVSPADLHVYDYDWSPDDQQFVVTAAPGPGDNNWWIAQLYLIDTATGHARSVYKPALQVAIPRWSPDGQSIAFIEGLMSDEGFHGGDLLTLSLTPSRSSAASHAASALTVKHSVSALFWQRPERILFTEAAGGGSAISELTLENGDIKTLWKGDEDVHAFGNFPNFVLSRNGALSAVVRSSFQEAPEVWAGPVGQWRKLTDHNRDQHPSWGQAQSLQWTNDGFTVQGWLLPPKEVQPNRRYPMVVLIHGGPSGVARPKWPSEFALAAVLASQGYFVLEPNPRGSYGQGEAFTQANVKDFGGGDLRDILAGVDAAIARYPIDPQRLGVTGWSYGGYMTMWTVTQTKRFRAAMAGAGLANWQSYYGQNLIDQWMIPFFGASVYDDPAVYAKSSPITFIKNVQTPTLIQVGEYDAECPAPQSYEFWHALRTLGVPTQLVVYAGEGHLFMKPRNRTEMQDRTIAWFNKYLK